VGGGGEWEEAVSSVQVWTKQTRRHKPPGASRNDRTAVCSTHCRKLLGVYGCKTRGRDLQGVCVSLRLLQPLAYAQQVRLGGARSRRRRRRRDHGTQHRQQKQQQKQQQQKQQQQQQQQHIAHAAAACARRCARRRGRRWTWAGRGGGSCHLQRRRVTCDV
jgi:hypothetical protein